MNFEQIRLADGKKDEKGYQIKIAMFGTVNSFEPVQFTKDGKRFQQVIITDDNNERQKVKIWLGKDKTIGDGFINRRLAFNIAPNPFKNIMYYGGFWNERVTVEPAKTPARASIPPSNPLYSPTPQSNLGTISEDWARCKVLCAYIQGERALGQGLYELVLQDVKFIKEGEKYFTPEPDPSITEGGQDDIDAVGNRHRPDEVDDSPF
ncbi:MAG: hypothetical protein PHG53_09680 [Phycisphaerae bacterium]|nr:hypothetical protein [Phycisphaerae bacterium]